MKDSNQYQLMASRTLWDSPGKTFSDEEIMLVWNAFGLSGEAGEVAELIKKGVFHQHGIDRDKLIKELGDCCWYIAALCTKLGIPFSEVLDRNIEKLKERYPEGFSTQASVDRIDTESDR